MYHNSHRLGSLGSCRIYIINPKPYNPIDPLKEPLKGTLIDPFKGTPGFISSLSINRINLKPELLMLNPEPKIPTNVGT